MSECVNRNTTSTIHISILSFAPHLNMHEKRSFKKAKWREVEVIRKHVGHQGVVF